MSEVVVVEGTPVETVIELGDGTVIDTVVDQEVQTVIEVPQDPIVIDLNSGARGEPGSRVLTGPAYPTLEQGAIGDLYIITEGDTAVGNVYEREAGAWVEAGNVRGPAGGIDSVNGYYHPNVVLNKADIGLNNVDNTSDLNKPISTATQSALDTTVKLTGNQTIAGIKTFSSAPVVPDGSFAIAKTSGLQAALDAKQATIAAGTTSQYYRGDKTWATLDKSAVGLGNVANLAQVDLVNTQTVGGYKTFSLQTTFNGGIISTGAAITSLGIKPVGDHGYISFYSRDATPATRTAYVGVGSAASTVFTIANEMTNGNLSLTTTGTGIITTNATLQVSAGNLLVPSGSLTVSGTITGSGSGITNINGSNVSTGTVADARLSSNVALLTGAQTFTGLKSFTGGISIIGSSMTFNVPTDSVGGWARGKNFRDISGTTMLGGVGMYGNSATVTNVYLGHGTSPWDGALGLRILTNGSAIFSHSVSAASFSGSGASLTALNGTQVTTGTVADARLSTNVALLTGAQTFTGTKTFSVAPVVPDSSFTIAKTTGLQSALDAKAPLASPTFTGTVSGITKAMVGLGNVDNTTDAAKPVSTATQTALNAKVNNTGAETIAGIKTFSSAPVVPDASFTIAKTSGLQAALDAKAPLASPTFTGTVSGNGSGLTALNGSNISTGTVAPERLGNAVVRVNHGSTAGTARPAGVAVVQWYGSVSPTNAVSGDEWIKS